MPAYSVDDLSDDSSDAVSPCDEVKNVMKDFPNVDDVSNAGASVAEASVSAPEDVFNCIMKNLTGFKKKHFSPKNVIAREVMLRVFPWY